MSLILDALNRADRERNEQGNNALFSEASSASDPKVYPVKRWILEAVIIIAITIFALYPLRDSRLSTKISELSPAVVSSAPAGKFNPEPTTVEVEPRQSTHLYVPKHSNPIVKTDSTMTPSANPAISALYDKPIDKKLAKTVVKENEADDSRSSADESVDNTQSILESIPTLSQFSPQFRNSIPSIEYTVHVYSENAGFVVLNGKKYQTGNELNSNLTVIAVLKESVVLDFGGKQFQLPALNSWVNYR